MLSPESNETDEQYLARLRRARRRSVAGRILEHLGLAAEVVIVAPARAGPDHVEGD